MQMCTFDSFMEAYRNNIILKIYPLWFVRIKAFDICFATTQKLNYGINKQFIRCKVSRLDFPCPILWHVVRKIIILQCLILVLEFVIDIIVNLYSNGINQYQIRDLKISLKIAQKICPIVCIVACVAINRENRKRQQHFLIYLPPSFCWPRVLFIQLGFP